MTEDEMKKLFTESIYAGQNDFGWFKSGVLMAEKYFKEIGIMTKEEAKQMSDILSAYADGRTIECKVKGNQKGWRKMLKGEAFLFAKFDYRIKPTPKTRRMTKQELSDWLRDCPEEHREYMKLGMVFYNYSYRIYQEDEELEDDILIRRNHGEWEKPIVEE